MKQTANHERTCRQLLRALALAALLLLAACTGTSSLQAPRLLVVTFGTETDARVALVRDDGPAGAAAERLAFLADSVRSLPGRALALDVVDRANQRSELLLLLRSGGDFSLAFLNLQDIDPAAPAAFARSRPDLALNPLLAGTATDVANLCLTDVQVTQDGRFVTLLNGGPGCPDSVSDAPELFIVDLDGMDLALSLAPSNELLAVRPFIGQDGGTDGDQLYYLVGATGWSAELWRTPLPPLPGSPRGEAVGLFAAGSSSDFPRDLARGADGMLALRSGSVSLLPPEGASRQVPTPATPVSFIRDPFGTELEQVLVLRTAGFSVHRTAADANPFTGPLPAVSGATVDPERLYVYFLSAGAIRILDILELPATSDLNGERLRSHRVSELQAPTGLITWIASAPPLP
jgi:hypothetical protein